MRAFVTGATGTIGFRVATALRRAGHRVWGLARDPARALALERAEIHSVMGCLEHPEAYRAVAAACSLLVHTAFDYAIAGIERDRLALDTLIAAARESAERPTLVYTSGVWVHGNTGPEPADESTPLRPFAVSAWRPAHERLALDAEEVRGLVLRPGCVYGYQGSLTSPWFAGATGHQPLEVVGDGANRWTMVHLDDLADAYVRTAECGLSGEVFEVTGPSRATVGEILAAILRAAGASREVHWVPLEVAQRRIGPLAEALAADQHVDAGKARRLLGWTPRHPGLAEEAAECLTAWRAHHQVPGT